MKWFQIIFNDVSLCRVKWWIFHGRKFVVKCEEFTATSFRDLLVFVIHYDPYWSFYSSFCNFIFSTNLPMSCDMSFYDCCIYKHEIFIGSLKHSILAVKFIHFSVDFFHASKLFFFPKRLLVDKFCDIMWHLNGVTQSYHPCDNMTLFNELFIEENCHSH